MNRKYMTVILILSVILFASSAWPDFGSFSGNSDYSSSRSSSGSSGRSSSSSHSSSSRSYSSGTTTRRSSSSGSSWNGGMSTVPITYGISSSSGVHSDEDEEFENQVAGFVFILLVGYFLWKIVASKKKKHREQPVIVTPERILRPMDEYLSLDPEFNDERIKAMVSNLYVQMQDTWQKKDISSLRPYFTDEFYSRMDRQLNEFRRTGRTDHTERIAVLSVDVIGWRQSGGMDYIVVGLNSRIVSYVLDDRTGRLVSGDMNREKFMEYEIELSRKTGTITNPEGDDIKTETCPHCGAPLKLNASAQCEYCGSVITRVNTSWAVSGMRGISQRTA